MVADRADDQRTHGASRNDADYVSNVERYTELLQISAAKFGANRGRHEVLRG